MKFTKKKSNKQNKKKPKKTNKKTQTQFIFFFTKADHY